MSRAAATQAFAAAHDEWSRVVDEVRATLADGQTVVRVRNAAFQRRMTERIVAAGKRAMPWASRFRPPLSRFRQLARRLERIGRGYSMTAEFAKYATGLSLANDLHAAIDELDYAYATRGGVNGCDCKVVVPLPGRRRAPSSELVPILEDYTDSEVRIEWHSCPICSRLWCLSDSDYPGDPVEGMTWTSHLKSVADLVSLYPTHVPADLLELPASGLRRWVSELDGPIIVSLF